jgi:alpha-galactosidase
MPTITLLGAGSTVFARNLLGDILQHPELAEATINLHDIDEARLRETEFLAHRLAKTLGANPKICSFPDRRAALDGADYAISMFQIGGYKPGTVIDFEIPKRYGLRQTIADTLGIGGIMRGLRTIPVMLAMLRDMEELCPTVTFLNYVNPMAILCWAAARASKIRTIGLCHSVQGTAKELSKDLGLPVDEIDYLCAGINHMAFYLSFEQRLPDGGRADLYPRLKEIGANGQAPEWNLVRYEMLKRLGYFVTESSEHFAEYVPWFIKRDRPDLIEKFNIPLDEYIRRCELQIEGWKFMLQKLTDPASQPEIEARRLLEAAGYPEEIIQKMLRSLSEVDQVKQSHEYCSQIIHSMETGALNVVYGNVPNHGLIDNLPPDCIVEVPCLVDRNGVQPVRVGSLPPHLASLIQTNINVQRLTVEAALTRKREHIYHAAMLDPHTAAELDLDQIWSLVDDLIEAHGDYLPEYTHG